MHEKPRSRGSISDRRLPPARRARSRRHGTGLSGPHRVRPAAGSEDRTHRVRFRPRLRFAREIASSDQVRSPWTAAVVDYSPAGERPQWPATEYAAAPTLADWVERHGPLPEATVRALAGELAEGLRAVHRAGLAHRDLKPSNILLAPPPSPAHRLRHRPCRRRHPPYPHRRVIGSPGYMAPEQVTEGISAEPGNVFALGAVLVYALWNRPFPATGRATVSGSTALPDRARGTGSRRRTARTHTACHRLPAQVAPESAHFGRPADTDRRRPRGLGPSPAAAPDGGHLSPGGGVEGPAGTGGGRHPTATFRAVDRVRTTDRDRRHRATGGVRATDRVRSSPGPPRRRRHGLGVRPTRRRSPTRARPPKGAGPVGPGLRGGGGHRGRHRGAGLARRHG
ncbi:hypothetical protein FNH08_12935 [Streptomyces spongiae]|uniref:Protein kinase domain-containing protein n=1 Tax=Streptomyces spongiae TaxID=565072 RepID=A0A5N8XET1_9ACTN|nr:hypothetical protein [Streptomyces spongiae]